MENERGDSLKSGSTVDLGDRSLLALLEIGAAAVLIGSFSVPWYVTSGPGYTTWISAGGYSPSALLTQDLLIPFASLVAVVVTFAGLGIPRPWGEDGDPGRVRGGILRGDPGIPGSSIG